MHEGSLWCHIADCGTLGLKRVGLGLKRGLDGTGWRRESQIGDLSPRALYHQRHCIALHPLPDKIITALSQSLFACSSSPQREAFCPSVWRWSHPLLSITESLWSLALIQPPLGWGAEMKEPRNLVNRPLAKALIHTENTGWKLLKYQNVLTQNFKL